MDDYRTDRPDGLPDNVQWMNKNNLRNKAASEEWLDFRRLSEPKFLECISPGLKSLIMPKVGYKHFMKKELQERRIWKNYAHIERVSQVWYGINVLTRTR